MEKKDRRRLARQLLKRHKEPKTDFFKLNLNQLKNDLGEIAELDNEHEFRNQAKYVQRVKKEIFKFADYLDYEFKRELNWSKDDWFPLKWMTDDLEISIVLDKYELIIPFINFIFNRNRYIRGKKYKKMVADTENIYDKKYTKRKWDYSVFKTDKDFYYEATRALKTSSKYIQKYIRIFRRMGAFKLLKDRHRQGYCLYADGYFVKTEQGIRKITFLTKGKHKKKLKNFTQYFLGTRGS